MNKESWDDYFMRIATQVATKSKDRSVKVGTVIVGEGHTILATGYNGFPRGVDDKNEAYHRRPEKYNWVSHDAQNAIFNAARHGIRLLGSTAYVTCHPCVDCARAFIQAGIKEVVIPIKEKDSFYLLGRWENWEASFIKAREVFGAGRVKVRTHAV